MAGKSKTTINTDLYDGLQQAKKKKLRYFALIAKGAEVVGLVVQKKVISDTMAQKAKSEFKGNLIVQGICVGDGADLKLEVTGTEPSIAAKKVKDFIAEHAGLALKPYWSVVSVLSAVEVQEASPDAAASGNGDSPVSTPSAIKRPSPSVKEPSPSVKDPSATLPKSTEDAKGLQDRLKKLLDRNKELVLRNPELRERLQPFTKPAAGLVMNGSSGAAEALDNLEQALDAAENAGQETARSQQQWTAEFARIEPRFLEVLRGDAPDASKLRAVMAYAVEQADAGAYEKALAALKRLEPLLDAAAKANGPADSAPAEMDPAISQPMGQQVESASGESPELLASKEELAEVLKRQSVVVQDALDLADEILKAAADLDKAGAALADSLEDDGEEEEETDEEESAAAAFLLERVLDVQSQAARLPEPTKKELQKRARQLQVAISGGDPGSLAVQVDALENELARATGAARVSEASIASGDSVSYRRLVFEWRDAQAKSRKQLDRFVAAFLADPEVQADRRFPKIRVAASEIARQMPLFGNDLEGALAAIDDCDNDAARAKARREARKVLADYSKTLDAAEGLHELQSLADDEFGGISFVSGLRGTLDKLGSQLAGVE